MQHELPARTTEFYMPVTHCCRPGAICWTLLVACLVGTVTPAVAQEVTAKFVAVDAKTIPDIGAGQGISVRDGHYYVYGDWHTGQPRVGVIRELNAEFKPTAKFVRLEANGKPLITHPTGLTFDAEQGTFIGDTVNNKGVIFQIDWAKAWADGNLTNAVLARIEDDAATAGTRPEFVTYAGQRWLATADYGQLQAELRLYDVAKLIEAGRSSAPGVIGHRIPCGLRNQNLHWDAARGELTCVQNRALGKGWQLEVIHLAKALEAKSATAPPARVSQWVLSEGTELEGYRPLTAGRCVCVVSRHEQNVLIGTLEPVTAKAEQLEPAGEQR